MNAIIEKDLHKTQVRLEAPEGGRDTYAFRLLLSGSAPVLLPCSLCSIDNKEYLIYDTTGMRPLHTELARGRLSGPDVRRLLTCLLTAWGRLSDCLLSEEGIRSDPGYLFTDTEGTVRFLYDPSPEIEKGHLPFLPLAESLIDAADPEDSEAILLTFRFFRIAKNCGSVPKDLETILVPPSGDPAEADTAILPLPSVSSCSGYAPRSLPEIREEPEDFFDPPSAPGAAGDGRARSSFSLRSFLSHLLHPEKTRKKKTADTVLLDELPSLLSAGDEPEDALPEEDPPTVLLRETAAGPALVPDGHAFGRIPLGRPPVTIGKLPSFADAVIPHPTVSRVHAKISSENGEYYIEDLGSRNGTHVNGKEVLFPGRVCLKNGDRVRFAAVSYIFRA